MITFRKELRKMKTLYIMRHGQTLFNLRQKIQGFSDSPLTQTGIEQSLLARRFFEKNQITFDALYSSTQERAADTLELVAFGELKTENQKRYTRLKGIKEWNFGIMEAEDEYISQFVRRTNTLDPSTYYGDCWVNFDGESSVDVQKRMVETLVDLMNAQKENATVLAVAHGGCIAQFMRYWLDENSEITLSNIRMTNCTCLKFGYSEGVFNLTEVIDTQGLA
jgi:probable phosphoglycerate mutase